MNLFEPEKYRPNWYSGFLKSRDSRSSQETNAVYALVGALESVVSFQHQSDSEKIGWIRKEFELFRAIFPRT